MYQAVGRFRCINALLSILQIHTELAPLAWSLAILTKTSWKTSNKIPLLMKCIRLWEDFVSTLLYPVSLLIGGWDWVQGGNPLYATVKCLSGRRGQIWHFFKKKLQKAHGTLLPYMEFNQSSWATNYSLHNYNTNDGWFPLVFVSVFWSLSHITLLKYLDQIWQLVNVYFAL